VHASTGFWRRMPTLGDRWSPTENSFGLMRQVMACVVILAHCWPIGFAEGNPGDSWTSGQTDIGFFALFGLISCSGYLNADSGVRITAKSFAKRRFLRIFPGWRASLIVTALVIAPLVALYENGTLRGFWTHPDGPFSYITTNVGASMAQFPISGLLAHVPYARMVGGPSAFAGSLWTLHYEFGCYVVIGVLIATGWLRRSPRIVLWLTLAAFAVVLVDLLRADSWTIRPVPHGAIGPYPIIGSLAFNWTVYFGWLFLLGATARLYMHRIPMHGAVAAVVAVVLALSAWRGGYLVIGPPAYTYLMVYVAVALPPRLHRYARKRDYSFGIYIYGFAVQQVLALVGGARYGIVAYIALSFAGTLVLAAASWHFVERPALRLKNVSLRQVLRSRLDRRSPPTDADSAVPPATVALPNETP